MIRCKLISVGSWVKIKDTGRVFSMYDYTPCEGDIGKVTSVVHRIWHDVAKTLLGVTLQNGKDIIIYVAGVEHLADAGEVPIELQTYAAGDIFKAYGTYYKIVATSGHHVIMYNINANTRWRDQVYVQDTTCITHQEMCNDVANEHDFPKNWRLVKDANVEVIERN